MVASENGLMYVVIPGDPLKNFMTALHFFGDDFKVCEEGVLVRIGRLFDAHLILQDGEYQTYLVNKNVYIPWSPLQVSRYPNQYRFLVSKEVWCTKKPGPEHAYFPDENSRILFEKYFGIR